MSTPTLDASVDACAEAVAATFGVVFARIDAWRARLEEHVSAAHGIPAVTELDGLVEELTVPELSAPGAPIIGAGFVAAPGFLPEAEFHLAWWLGHANTFGVGSAEPAVRRLRAVEDPHSESFRDYTALEWWRVPATTGDPHITGPYVDYLCTDDYTLTLTAPARHDGTLIGVVGADLYVTDMERVLLPHVRAVGGTATIVNGSGRVVVSTDARRATGSVLRDARATIPCGTTGLALLLG